MKLVPVYPARHPSFVAVCSNCGETAHSETCFADLDEKPGTYVCVNCVGAYHMIKSEIDEKLLERDSKEIKAYGSFYSTPIAQRG